MEKSAPRAEAEVVAEAGRATGAAERGVAVPVGDASRARAVQLATSVVALVGATFIVVAALLRSDGAVCAPRAGERDD